LGNGQIKVKDGFDNKRIFFKTNLI